MQTSAEYRACYLQAFKWAKKFASIRLSSEFGLKNAVSPRTKPRNRPPAIILDLDETVFDNRVFQTKQIRGGWAYNQTYWSQFEQNGGADVVPIPGAISFLEHAGSIGVQPVFITNRNVSSHEKTLDILKCLKIEVSPDWRVCADVNTKSSKDSRRALVRERFDVLLLIGDNLRDFEDFLSTTGAKVPLPASNSGKPQSLNTRPSLDTTGLFCQTRLTANGTSLSATVSTMQNYLSPNTLGLAQRSQPTQNALVDLYSPSNTAMTIRWSESLDFFAVTIEGLIAFEHHT
jgi:HAD superfamily, subfamily IIIB (Acid phosphatase)